MDAKREARFLARERRKQVFDRHLVPRYISMERRRVCPIEDVGTYDLCARARQQKSDAEGQPHGQPPRHHAYNPVNQKNLISQI